MRSLTLRVVLHPVVNLLSHRSRVAKIHFLHVSLEVFPHQVKELWVKRYTLLQEEAVGEADQVFGVILLEGRHQVVEQ